MLPPLKPIAMKERISLIFIERGIPVGNIACIFLDPRVTSGSGFGCAGR